MEQLLSSIDPNLVVLICGGLCVVGVLGAILLQVLGGALGALGNIVDVFFGILGGGPEAWCGCIVGGGILVLCCGITVTIVSVLSTCNTPDAVNFCRLF